jgi:hypothetical protein
MNDQPRRQPQIARRLVARPTGRAPLTFGGERSPITSAGRALTAPSRQWTEGSNRGPNSIDTHLDPIRTVALHVIATV